MRFPKALALLGTLVCGALGLPGTASASPFAAAAMPAAQAGGLVENTQYGGPPYGYGPRSRVRVYPAPIYRPVRRVVRPYPIYRPRPVVRYHPVYRPYPRTVCRIRVRTVLTRYGYVRRPVRICTRRF